MDQQQILSILSSVSAKQTGQFHNLKNLLEEAKEHIKFAYTTCRVEEHLANTTIEWNPNLITTAGRAKRLKSGKYLIELNPNYYTIATPEQRKNTSIHEACHIIELIKYNRISHSWRWKHLMMVCREKPSRCHNLTELRPKSKDKRRRFRCGCPNGCLVGPTQTKRMLSGVANYRCKFCSQKIEPIEIKSK